MSVDYITHAFVHYKISDFCFGHYRNSWNFAEILNPVFVQFGGFWWELKELMVFYINLQYASEFRSVQHQGHRGTHRANCHRLCVFSLHCNRKVPNKLYLQTICVIFPANWESFLSDFLAEQKKNLSPIALQCTYVILFTPIVATATVHGLPASGSQGRLRGVGNKWTAQDSCHKRTHDICIYIVFI